MSAPPRVKVCGLTRREDAEVAAEAGAAFLGVVLAPGGRRSVTADAAGVILQTLAATRVGVFVDAGEDAVRRDAETACLHVLQLHGDEPPETAHRLRAAGWCVWKAVRVRTVGDFTSAAARYAGAVDALLLDGWSPLAPGGTGARFPWEEVAERRAALPSATRLVAAGGLNPENVARAARILSPDVVDVSSGVELSPGVKDPEAVRRFLAAVRRGDASPTRSGIDRECP